MAVFYQTVIQRSACWLLPNRAILSRVSSRGLGRSTIQDKPLTVEDLPHTGLLAMLYRMMFQGFHNRLHELQIYEKQLYGSMYRDGLKAVSINTPKLLGEVMRNDDKFPCRGDMTFWREYRDIRGFGYGPFTVEGERWYKLRVLLNQRMLRPKDSFQYSSNINDVVQDFIKRIYYVRQCSPTGDLVSDLSNEFYRFGLEAISSILFETKLGCLEKEIPEGTQEFIGSISQMFTNSMAAMIMPKWSRCLLPYWQRFIDGWDGIFSFARRLIDRKLEAIQQCIDNNQDVEGQYLTSLLSNPDLSTHDVYASVTELLLAGVDTTSNTLTWTLYLLSTHPQIQENLYKEVSAVGSEHHVSPAEEVFQLPYLKAIIKEVLRMYPVVPLHARVISERAVVIGGYEFPKNTTFRFSNYAITHDEEVFPEPYAFKPERWLRNGSKKQIPFGSIPFGFGVRGCVGRRVAELEMYTVLVQLIRLFEVKPDPMVGEVKALTHTVLKPDRKINLHFVERASGNAA